MEIRQLRYFLAVAQERHFGRAAERLHIVPSGLSHQVRRLERELGVDLFDRTTRQVTLTAAGDVLLAHAEEVLAAEQRAAAAIGTLRHRQDRRVRLGTASGLGDRLDAILGRFRELEPDGELVLSTGPLRDRTRQVRGGELDATLLRGGELGGGLEMVEVWTDTMVVAVAAGGPLDGCGPVHLTQLADARVRLAAPERNRFLHSLVVSACADAGFSPRFGPEFTTDQDTLAAIAHDPEPSWTVFYEAKAVQLRVRGVKFRRAQGSALRAPTFLAVRRAARSPGLEALIAACQESGFSRRRSRPRRGAAPGPPS